MKKITGYFLLTAILLSFGGCFNFGDDAGGEAGTSEEGYTTYKTDNFSITVPEKWEVINENEFTSDVPEVTEVVFRNNVKNETFTANVNIVSKELQEPLSTLEYAKMVINRQSSGLVNYKELTKENAQMMIAGEEKETLLNRFEAKKTSADNLVRYAQTYGVKENKGYIVTGAVSTQESESVVQTVEKIVKSFRLI